MPRPKWVEPENEEQRRAIADLEAAVKAFEDAEKQAKAIIDEARERVWAAARVARKLRVPARFIAGKTSRGRTTVHRHVPPPGQDAGEQP
ncbi:hypothetical protein GCM10009557_66540 [Virgisporangium ochraceum]|uniref:Uncharacterized protein n=1 Tax=Virgisporangium ochraceum TaxID=65505 RepID=A0A8J3ZLE7_9ACTN|nr:hypothetical protein [Virgisporangium ochraceum]GIJ66227.1 hypothetical protein Voc01_011440 [Virgisporangium ochraceum]